MQPRIMKPLTVPHDDLYQAFTHSQLITGVETFTIDPGIDRSITAECFLALSTTYFGMKHHEKTVITQGLSRYSAALQTVHKALADENASRSFDVLEAVMIIAVVEFLVSEREHGWISHARGFERLLESWGPERISYLPSLLVFEKCRASMIFAALVLRQTTILAEHDWKFLPWAQFPGRVNSIKLLTDILADCPELFALHDQVLQMQTNQNSHDIQLRLLLKKAEKICGNLHQWNAAWAKDNGQVFSEVLPPITTPCSLNPFGKETLPWTSVFQFESLYHANALTLYHATLILVLRFVASVRCTLGEVDDEEFSKQQTRSAGLFICRSVDYHLNQTWTELGAFNLLFPLRMAYEAVGREHGAIGLWLQKVLEDVSTGKRGIWKSAKAIMDITGSFAKPNSTQNTGFELRHVRY
ncbi:hypothetical protein yc1106_01928 [Curvularia clavata]|uniref:Uncharacterized protein n=1 Tax=Curvularia clavata TaxID=95742 RepID=A0A9Q8Z2A3_CURCL|nr:hypothetical protein yc1106_01928 [Curvularia clavata]